MTNVYVFGSGDCGQLGMGEDVDLKKRPSLHPFFTDKGIVSVAAGGLHSLALSSTGHVYSWGCDDEKALGHSHQTAEFEVGKVGSLDGLGVVQVVAGDSISAALTASGDVYTWGTFRDSRGVMGHSHAGDEIQAVPTKIAELTKIVQIAAGSNHLMALTADGQLFSWGCGEQGQLGRRVLERHKMLALRPTNITPRHGRTRVVIRRVVCGSYHTLAISDDGNVYAMGLNNYGQLGLGDHEERLTAELVDPGNWNGSRVVEAGAGEHHSMVLLSTGQVLTFGRADFGQLGVQTTERAHSRPLHVALLEHVRLIASGSNHCLAANEQGQVVSWGYGEMYELGHGVEKDEMVPRLIEAPLNGKVLQLAAGGHHSIILVQ